LKVEKNSLNPQSSYIHVPNICTYKAYNNNIFQALQITMAYKLDLDIFDGTKMYTQDTCTKQGK
jgi:hypothetical protein